MGYVGQEDSMVEVEFQHSLEVGRNGAVIDEAIQNGKWKDMIREEYE